MNKLAFSVATLTFLSTGLVFANDTADLDDIKLYDIVKVEQCLDQAYDTVPGHARKLEFKIEGDDPFYEFDIESSKDGFIYNVECNAEEGYITELKRKLMKTTQYSKVKLKLPSIKLELKFFQFIQEKS